MHGGLEVTLGLDKYLKVPDKQQELRTTQSGSLGVQVLTDGPTRERVTLCTGGSTPIQGK